MSPKVFYFVLPISPVYTPTKGGEFKGCHSSPWQAKGHSGMFR